MQCVYLNGKLLPPDQALISPFDRGFIFGDGVYEVIPVYGGRLFRLKQHLQRLENSLNAISLKNPMRAEAWEAVFIRLIKENAGGDLSIYLQITRGVAARDHAFPTDTIPTVFVYAQKLKYPDQSQLASGVAAITLPDTRWMRCDIKAICLLPNAMMRQRAAEEGAAEAILIRDHFITEGAASNVFIVSRGRLITPPKGQFILPGVTRDLVLELASASNVACIEQAINETEFFSADEIWMTSSTKEILPITRVDGKAVGAGKPGPLHARMYALYQEYKQAFRAGRAE
ncbi:MAG TPA: D-amino acid aminotransferase [Acidiferrobacterales bacterium]|nr:D-amino acid aminotransferase [Acidiferrobacterales bacterium]